jgi:hypothetical protein
MSKMEFCVERLKFKSKSELVSYLVDRYYARAKFLPQNGQKFQSPLTRAPQNGQ